MIGPFFANTFLPVFGLEWSYAICGCMQVLYAIIYAVACGLGPTFLELNENKVPAGEAPESYSQQEAHTEEIIEPLST